MSLAQPSVSDTQNDPPHYTLHQIIAADVAAPVKSLAVDSSGNAVINATKRLYLDGVAGVGGDTYIDEVSANTIRFVTGGSEAARFDSALALVTKGSVRIEPVSGANPIFEMADTDIAHGITSRAHTDVLFQITQMSSTVGGAMLLGFSEGTSDKSGLYLQGLLGSTDPADDLAAVRIVGSRKSGTDRAAMADDETLLGINNNFGSDLIVVFGKGTMGFNGTMGDSTKDPTSDAPDDWVELKIGAATYYAPVYAAS